MYRRTINLGRIWLLASFALACFTLPTQAQVVPDATLGAGKNSVTTTTGDRTDITGGLRRSSALFHSFDRFSINTNRQVYFANPTGIRNIFSRITGSSISNIDGLLGVSGQANLFLMNPNGIIFGPNARLDVAGSFLATTANVLEFADGQRFAADGDRAVPLVEVNIPIGLQVAANSPAMLNNQGNLTAGQDLTLAAGNLDLQGQLQAGGNLTLKATDTVKIRDTVTEPFLARSGGNLTIQGNQGIDILALNHLSQMPFVSGGNLNLVSDGLISTDAHFNAGGNFSIRTLAGNPANFVSLHDPIVTAGGNYNVGAYTGASLQVNAGGNIDYGNVVINAVDFSVDPLPAFILRAGGDITANGDVSTSVAGGLLKVDFQAVGDINISSPNPASPRFITAQSTAASGFSVIRLDSTGGSVILNGAVLRASNTNPSATAGAGDIFIKAARAVTIDSSLIENDGAFGRIFIGRANVGETPGGESVALSKSYVTASNSLGGVGGTIDINVPGNLTTPASIALTKTSLRTPSSGTANGGRIDLTVGTGGTITATAALVDASISGTGSQGGGVGLTAPNGTIFLNDSSQVTTAASGTSAATQANPIDLTALNGTVTLSGNSALNATTSSIAPGGDITIAANTVTVNQSSRVDTTVQGDATGKGGNITLTVGTLTLDQGGRVQARTFGPGDAGDIQLTITNTASISGFDVQSQLYSGVLTDTLVNPVTNNANSGRGGNIRVNSPGSLVSNLTVSDGGFLSARTVSAAPGGNIEVNINNLDILRGGQILTSSASTGAAGSITVNAANNVTISGNRIAPATPVSPFTNPTFLVLSLDGQTFNTVADPIVEDSNTLPYLSLQRNPTGANGQIYAAPSATGSALGGTNLGTSNNFDYYSFSISRDGSRAIFDVDNAASVPGSPLDTELFLFDALSGQLLFSNDDFFPTDPGSSSSLDSRIAYTFTSAGRYVLGVGRYNSTASSGNPITTVGGSTPLGAADAYRLQVSLQNQGTGAFNLSDRNPNQGLNSGLFAQSLASGAGNNINITANSLALTNQAQLSATTVGQANGGNITVMAGARTPLPVTQNAIVVNGGRIQTSIEPPVNQTSAGSPTVVSGNINLMAQTGSILLSNAPTVTRLEDSTIVSASTADVGTGGTVSLQTTGGGSVSILNGARIESRTTGVGNASSFGGNAGNVVVNAPDITIAGQTQLNGQPIFSGLLASSDTAKSGLEGTIFINTEAAPGNNLVIADGAFLSTLNRSDQEGGGIEVNVNRLQLLNGGQIVTAAEGLGGAGSIVVRSPNVTIAGSSSYIPPSNAAGGGFSLTAEGTIDFSTLVPHQTRVGTAGQVDYYSFDIAAAGNRAVFDIDNANTGFNDTEIFLFRYDPGTNQSVFLARNDDSRVEGAARGSSDLRDSYLDYRFDQPGRYILAVAPYSGGTAITPSAPNQPSVGQPVVTPSFFDATRQYTLQTSIDGRNTFNPNSSPSSGLFAQSTAIGGAAGSIRVEGGGGGALTLQDGAQISGSTVSGRGDNITLQGLNTLQITNSLISASTTGNGGTAGSVNINANQSVTVNGTLPSGITPPLGLPTSAGGISTQASNGNGSAGSVAISTPQLTVQNGASIVASTETGNGNGITLNNLNTLQLDRGTISASTRSGRSGNISVNGNGTAQVNLTNGSQITGSTVSGTGGRIDLNGLANLQVANSLIAASTTGAGGSAGNVTINAAQAVTLTGTLPPGSTLPSGITPPIGGVSTQATSGNGSAGEVTIATRQLTVQDGAAITASTATGAGSDITLQGLNRLELDNGAISASTQSGRSGNILVNGNGTAAATVQNGSRISASNDSSNVPNTGNVTLRGLNTLQVDNSTIESSTRSGTAGSVVVEATQSVTLRGTLPNGDRAGLAVEASQGGSAGSVTITTPDVEIANGASIAASSRNGAGRAGGVDIIAATVNLSNGAQISAETDAGGADSPANITLQGLQTLNVNSSDISSSTNSGQAGSVKVNAAQQVNLNNNGRIAAEARQGGSAGSVSITTPDVEIANGASIAASSKNGAGRAGGVDITAATVNLSNGAQISAETDAGGANSPANITFQGLQQLNVNNSLISSSTNRGSAGSVTVGAPTGQVRLDGDNSGIIAEARQGGSAGNVEITAGKLLIQNGARAAVSSPKGQAGNLTVRANSIRLDRGTLSAETATGGDGANIAIETQQPFLLRYGSLISASAGQQANGGTIQISTPFLIGLSFENSDIIANSVRGRGGTINITTNAIFGLAFRPKLTPRSDITASSEFGVSGNVIINSLNLDPSRGLTQLPTDLVDRTSQIAQGCSVGGNAAEKESQFTIAGRGGVPLSPTALLPAQAGTSDWVALDNAALASSPLPDGSFVVLKPGQTYQVQTVCVNSWKHQQRSNL